MSDGAPDFLTTRELADLLRIKERKVYDLASSGEVPCVRAVGKLLFPRAEVEAWLAASGSGPETRPEPLPAILAGSHDPLLDWALRESGSGLAAFMDGSMDGLDRLARRQAAVAGLHLHEPGGGWNVAAVAAAMPAAPVVVVEFARRDRGLILAPGLTGQVTSLAGLAGKRFARRQPGAASQRLFEHLAGETGLDLAALPGPESPARSEADVALIVAEGKADCAFGLACMARQFRLGFVPIISERYDLAIWRHAWFEPPFQRLLEFMHGNQFAAKAEEMTGYDISGLGQVHYNGPGR